MVVAVAHVAVGELAEGAALADCSPGASDTTSAAKGAARGEAAPLMSADAQGDVRVEPGVHELVESLIQQKKEMDAKRKASLETCQQSGVGSSLLQLWVGIGGAPGSGKSSLANVVARRLSSRGFPAVVIPMDGFHYTIKQLDAMPDPAHAHARRGAPFTFDSEALVDTIFALKRAGSGQVPSFDHALGDPVPGGVKLDKSHVIVLVEGNYLLLWDEAPWCKLEEAFDCTWFLDCPEEVLRERVIRRNSAAWGWDYDRTAAKVDANDMPNARLVASTRQHANQIIVTHTTGPEPASSSADENRQGRIVQSAVVTSVEGMRQALFIQTGFGACQKGTDATKAAVRAARNAIEFNSVPAIRLLCSDTRSDMIVQVSVAVPRALVPQVDLSKVKEVFPHGEVSVRVQEGGGLFCSGTRLVDGQEKPDEMLVAVAHIVVGR